MITINSERLTLVAATMETAEAELNDRNLLEPLTGVKFPYNWPPPLNDEDSMKWFYDYLCTYPGSEGWVAWYYCLKMADNTLLAIGSGGFKGKPDENGVVEIGYSIMEEHQRKGYASEAVKALTRWAFGFPNVNKIIAQTFPENSGSIKVLGRCGFKFVGDGLEDNAIMFELLKV
jgi:Acetyltransferases, including N-acetylases of ribosomal proteins